MFILDLNTVKKYIKNLNVIDSDNIMISKLSQPKFYLKILGIPYLIEDTNISISSDIIEKILQSTYIFNDVVLTLKPKVIKVSSKLDMAVIWIDIWDAQSCYDSRLKVLSQETTLVLEWYKRTQ